MLREFYVWFNHVNGWDMLTDYKDNYSEFLLAFWVIGTLLLALLILVGWMVYNMIYASLDRKGATVVIAQGKIITHAYQPAISSSGSGYGMSNNGAMTVVSTSSSSPETYNVIVMEMDGIREVQAHQISVDLQQYARLSDRSMVKFSKTIGRLSGKVIDKMILL